MLQSVRELVPKNASLWGHLFENHATGLVRGIYWGLRVEFDPIQIEEDEWDLSLAVEWLRFPVQNWTDLDGITQDQLMNSTEVSIYCGRHQEAELRSLSLANRSGCKFDLRLSVLVGLDLPDEVGTSLPEEDFDLALSAPLTELIVVPENLTPKPVSAEEALSALGTHIELRNLSKPIDEGYRFVFQPRP